MKNILWFSEIRKDDIPSVGGKGANLGELTSFGIPVPQGFVVTSKAYFDFLKFGSLGEKISHELGGLSIKDSEKLMAASAKIKIAILTSSIPKELKDEIKESYHRLSGIHDTLVAVRSSATAEDLPNASFAGQQETYLNVRGAEQVIESVRKCWASLFEPRAIFYREDMGFDHFKVGLAAVIQRMVESEVSGIMFTVDPITNDSGKINIESIFGLGQPIVSGEITPDQYLLDKKSLKIINKHVVPQDWQLIKAGKIKISKEYQDKQKLSDEKIKELAEYGRIIEEHYGFAQDIEWAMSDHKLSIVQARPVTTLSGEAVHEDGQIAASTKSAVKINESEVKEKLLLTGIGASRGIVSGPVVKVDDPSLIGRVKDGDILVAKMTSPDYVPAMKRALAIVTDEGGRTSHAAIVSRELGIPCVVGTQHATTILKDKEIITVDGANGKVYEGNVEISESLSVYNEAQSEKKTKTATKVYINLADPDMALELSKKHVDGVGLLRAEFIMANIGEHPRAMIESGRSHEYIEKLASQIAKVAKAFSPRPVVYRASDFKTNEYRNLKGGSKFEPVEENPLIGFRGAMRYVSDPEVFEMELKAITKVRNKLGHKNLWLMLPFVRTVTDLREVKKIVAVSGLKRGASFKIWLMVEIPANVILMDEFINEGIDGISIGSNDLTMLTLGADRDNSRLATYNEQNEAVLELIEQAIKTAGRLSITSSMCGEAPSVYPDILKKIIRWGITSVSVDPDVADSVRGAISLEEKDVITQK
jgi:pyruvate,water dikinase